MSRTTDTPLIDAPSRGRTDYDDLLRRIIERDQDAATELSTALWKIIGWDVRKMLRYPEAQEDVCWRVLMTVWKNAPRYYDPAKGNAITWIKAVAYRVTVDVYREQRYRDKVVFVKLWTGDEDSGKSTHSDYLHHRPFDDPVLQAEYQDACEVLDGTLALARWKGMTDEEFARLEGVKTWRVRRRWGDDKERMARALDVDLSTRIASGVTRGARRGKYRKTEKSS